MTGKNVGEGSFQFNYEDYTMYFSVEILGLCDSYNLQRREFYFDRSPRIFENILGLYRKAGGNILKSLQTIGNQICTSNKYDLIVITDAQLDICRQPQLDFCHIFYVKRLLSL